MKLSVTGVSVLQTKCLSDRQTASEPKKTTITPTSCSDWPVEQRWESSDLNFSLWSSRFHSLQLLPSLFVSATPWKPLRTVIEFIVWLFLWRQTFHRLWILVQASLFEAYSLVLFRSPALLTEVQWRIYTLLLESNCTSMLEPNASKEKWLR